MQFALPAALAQHVSTYDVEQRQADRLAARAATKRNPHTLGVLTNLFPPDVYPPALQAELTKQLHLRGPRERAWFTVLDNNRPRMVIHDAGVWMALWHDPDNDQAFVGATFICKKSLKDGLSFLFNGQHAGSNATEFKIGRTTFLHSGYVLTRQEVAQKALNLFTKRFCRYYKRYTFKHGIFQQFEQELFKSLPQWEDTTDKYARASARNAKVLIERYQDSGDFDSPLSAEWIENYYRFIQIRDVLSTPFFRSEINQVIRKLNQNFDDLTIREKRQAAKPWSDFESQISYVILMRKIWPNIEIDYLQNIYRVSAGFPEYHSWSLPDPKVQRWLEQHMPPSSLIQILHQLQAGNEGIHPLRDTFNLLDRIAHTDDASVLTLDPPPRWRISTFHDYANENAFKVATPNEILPQDLFPQPVKVHTSERKFSFFQPQDVHQLAAWGSAVRNCVGNASSYKEGVQKRTHFIVLALIDNKPRFTIQAQVKQNQLIVDQIADTCNKRLTEGERQQFQQAFAEALHIVSSTLPPADAGDTP